MSGLNFIIVERVGLFPPLPLPRGQVNKNGIYNIVHWLIITGRCQDSTCWMNQSC